MGSSTAFKVALLATCILMQQALAQRTGGSVGYGSGSSEDATGTGTGRGRTRGSGSSSGSTDSSNSMAMTLGGECPISIL